MKLLQIVGKQISDIVDEIKIDERINDKIHFEVISCETI